MHEKETYLQMMFIQHHDTLKKYCASLIHHDPKYMNTIDDCVQEAFYKAFIHYEQFHSSKNPFGWLANCCQYYYRPMFRKEKRRKEIVGTLVSVEEFGDIADPMDSVLQWLIQSDLQDIINEIMLTLTPLEKRVFHFYFEEQQSLKQTAKNTGYSINSIMGALQRIRKKAQSKKFHLFLSCIVYFPLLMHCIK